ncbi:membrane-spanning 4-domains subfamily A member 4A-like [Labeo rohita]|uniref:membrane-spanning 4-domains subfamily A member 4A-like n=1 Tax=Labeo rohita TaxID=84645 RepID=UPI0021E312D6|nr:membrane-spanning 4-domains subfamily A member 4A-like [Labeo rohita]XP_050966772.1 membrane-spanning 4-domains subfamily A member 4A-like [Labeo rohita]
METSEVISTDRATIAIKINPQEAKDSVIYDDIQEARGACHNTTLQKFFKAQPKALGTVQIMTGVIVFLLGIVLTGFPTISVISGITYWGSFIYISTGSLSVAAQNKLHPCVVKASLGMNVISAVTAGIAILLMAADMIITLTHINYYYNSNYGYIYSQGFRLRILGISLVFCILQLIISIFISAFACKATSSTDPTMVHVALNRGY